VLLLSCIALAMASTVETRTGEIVLDNPWVSVARNAAPCAQAKPQSCGDRVVVALGALELQASGKVRSLARGDVLVFTAASSYEPPAGEFVEVTFKPDHPPVEMPAVRIFPEGNQVLFDGERYFVFEESLAPGQTRRRHSHGPRVVVVINETRLLQWPDGGPAALRQQVRDDVHFNRPIVHVVKNVGDRPLRNIVIELKGEAR